MSPISKEMQALDQQLRNDMGAPDVRYMLILQADNQEKVLQQGEEIATLLQQQVKAGVLEGYDTPPLPSRRLQLARQSALPADAALRANLKQALRDQPFRSETFVNFPQEIAQAKQLALLERQQLQGSNLGLKLDSLLLQRESGWVLMLPLRGVQDAARISQDIREANPLPFILLDMKLESDQMFHDYRREAGKYTALGGLAIIALLFLSLRSARRVFDVSLPLLAALIVITALLALTGEGLSIFHLIGLLLVVAVGSNYTLFFEQLGLSGQDQGRTLISLLFANLSTMLGFGLLSFSQSPVLYAIGSTVALGAVLSLVFSAILIARPEH